MARGNGLRTTWHADPLNFAPGHCALSCVSGIGARDKGKLRNCWNVSETWLKKGKVKQQGKGWFGSATGCKMFSSHKLVLFH